MYDDFNFSDVLASRVETAWQVEDVLTSGAKLDFGRRFLPGAIARAGGLAFPSEGRKRVLDQIRGHEYPTLFGMVEELILPFMLDHARPKLNGGDHRRPRGLPDSASEGAGRLNPFRTFHQRFTQSFGTPCEAIGPGEAIAGRHRMLKWTYPGPAGLSPAARDRIAAVAPAFS